MPEASLPVEASIRPKKKKPSRPLKIVSVAHDIDSKV